MNCILQEKDKDAQPLQEHSPAQTPNVEDVLSDKSQKDVGPTNAMAHTDPSISKQGVFEIALIIYCAYFILHTYRNFHCNTWKFCTPKEINTIDPEGQK